MAHRTRIRPNLAAWSPGSAVQQSEYEALDAAQFAAIDGDAGGLWLPSSKLVIGGANGLDVAAPFRALGVSAFIPSMQAQNWPERASVVNPTPANNDVPIAYAPPSSGLGFNGCGLLVCTTFDTISCFSDDGTLWTNGGSFGGHLGSTAADIAYGIVGGSPSFLVSSSINGKLDKSTDGATWSVVAAGASVVGTFAVLCYAASIGLWVAAGAAGVVHTSTDGATWTSRTTPAAWIAGSGGAKRVVWNGSLFVILPSLVYSKFLTSPDGITWTERTVTAAMWSGLAYSSYDGAWMAVASSVGKAWRSADGLTWADTGSPAPLGQANDLAVNGPLWIATGLPSAVAPAVMWSVDIGTTWHGVSVGSHRVGPAGYRRVIVADDRFVATKAIGASIQFALSLRTS